MKFVFYYKFTTFTPVEKFSSYGKDKRSSISCLFFSGFVFVFFLSRNEVYELDWFIRIEDLDIGIRVCNRCTINDGLISMAKITTDLGQLSSYTIKRDTYRHAWIYQAGEVNGPYDA